MGFDFALVSFRIEEEVSKRTSFGDFLNRRDQTYPRSVFVKRTKTAEHGVLNVFQRILLRS